MNEAIKFSDFDFSKIPDLKEGDTLVFKFPIDKYSIDIITQIHTYLRDYFGKKNIDLISIPEGIEIMKKEE